MHIMPTSHSSEVRCTATLVLHSPKCLKLSSTFHEVRLNLKKHLHMPAVQAGDVAPLIPSIRTAILHHGVSQYLEMSKVVCSCVCRFECFWLQNEQQAAQRPMIQRYVAM